MNNVCVVGSFMMDLVARVHRRPERGETVVGSDFAMFLGGKGFNQAIAAARSGARTRMIGRVGDDDFGHRFLEALDRDGIDRTAVGVDAHAGTGVGLPVVDDSGDNSIVVIPRANHHLTPADVTAAADAIESSDVVLLQLELPLEVVEQAATIASAAGVLVILNPAPAAQFGTPVDIIVPNESEAAALTGVACTDQNLLEVAGALRSRAGRVVLTLGSLGAAVLDADGLDRMPGYPAECVDSVGAGDAFCGAMAARLAAGAALRDAVRYANAAGALAVTKHGAEPSMPHKEQIDALCH